MAHSNGYATRVRIEGVRPRFAAGRGRGQAAVVVPVPTPAGLNRGTQPEDYAGDSVDDWIGERWAAFRDAWSQTTFFLTDPNSWR
jgi:hypothetical protein